MSALDEKWRELVEAGKAEWMPGMLGPDGFRILTVRQDSRGFQLVFQLVSRGCGWTAPSLQSDFLPDWSDPATLGALLGQVEARYGEPVSVWWSRSGRCHVATESLMRAGEHWDGVTRADALLAALEAAP